MTKESNLSTNDVQASGESTTGQKCHNAHHNNHNYCTCKFQVIFLNVLFGYNFKHTKTFQQ